jgi:hypothetical protein
VVYNEAAKVTIINEGCNIFEKPSVIAGNLLI